MDIHAEKLVLIEKGYTLTERANKKKIFLSLAFFFLTLIIIAIFKKRM